MATSALPVDHDPGAGSYAGNGLFGLGRTILTLVILSLLFWWRKGSGDGEAIGAASLFPAFVEPSNTPIDNAPLASMNFLRSIAICDLLPLDSNEAKNRRSVSHAENQQNRGLTLLCVSTLDRAGTLSAEKIVPMS